MYYYCTLFDSNYLARGLALYESLLSSGEHFSLYIFCFDEIAYKILKKLDLKNVNLVSLSEFETKELLSIKKDRSRAEYCWTSTPYVIRYSLEKFKLEMVTYLDADLYFFQMPSLLLTEFIEAGESILITEHRYTPKYDLSEKSGIYCVQFITFKANKKGMKALKWWQSRCLEWCYARIEDGKFGDQKYLDDWPTRFENVHVLQHLGGGLAPWNIQQYDPVKKGNKLFIKDRISDKEIKAIFYHFHGLQYYENERIYLGTYELSPKVKEFFYRPYIQHIESIKKRLSNLESDFGYNYSKNPVNVDNLGFKVKNLLFRIIGNRILYNKDNVHSKNEFIKC